MDIEEYATRGRAVYAELAATVAGVLVAAIRANPHLRLQHVQHRSKEPDRLRAKLAKRLVAASNEIESEIKDLGGCRVVFYTNSDVSTFLSSGIVRDNFEIDWNRTKIHHPHLVRRMPTSYLSRTTTS